MLAPGDLEGKRVGIRSFTTTTGAWVRGILANDYGVNLGKVDWVTYEDPHVAEYVDATERAPKDKKVLQMLLDGEVDAVLGEASDDPKLKSLFPDPVAEAARWYARRSSPFRRSLRPPADSETSGRSSAARRRRCSRCDSRARFARRSC